MPALVKNAADFHGRGALLAALTNPIPATTTPERLMVTPVKDIMPPKHGASLRITIMSSSSSAPVIPSDFTDDDATQLMRDGVVIKDTRSDSDVSKTYPTEGLEQMFNPQEVGFYDVILASGDIEKCLVLSAPWKTSGRLNNDCLVVRAATPRSYVLTKPKHVWCVKAYEQSDFYAFVKDLPGVSPSADGHQVLLNARGVCTMPLRFESSVWADDGGSVHDIDMDCCGTYDSCSNKQRKRPGMYGQLSRLALDPVPGTHFRSAQGILTVPKSAKSLSVTDESLALGVAADMRGKIFRAFGKIAASAYGGGVIIRSNRAESPELTPVSALVHLVRDYGLRVPDAQDILKRAAAGLKAERWIKYASTTTEASFMSPLEYMEDYNGSARLLGGDSVPQQESMTGRSVPLNRPREPRPIQKDPNYDPIHRIDENAVGIAQDAAQKGIKDVFDAGALGSMLNSVRDDQVIDRYIPALAKAMDATGRLLFQFFWHQDDFAERYGDRDLPDLEDGLRNLFEGVSDITLKLKQKTVDVTPEDQALGVSLADLADGGNV
jgi:hypothetical protein